MAKYTAKIVGLTNDGTNLYVKVSISDGPTTMETIEATFPSDAAVATIKTYVQTIADNAPTMSDELRGIVGYTATQS